MKAIIYAGIGLFSVATVYGVTDFYQTQKSGTITNLYNEEEVEEPVVKSTKTLTEKDIAVKNVEEPTTEQKNTTQKTAKKKVKKIKAERTIRLEEYSRGRIEEPILPEKAESVVEELKPVAIAAPKLISTEKKFQKKNERRKIDLKKFSRAPLKVKKSLPAKEAALYEM